MSGSNGGQNSSASERTLHSTNKPRALIHRKILDVTEANPDASPTAIASEVDGASPTFVEQILDEFGDHTNNSHEHWLADGGKNETDSNVDKERDRTDTDSDDEMIPGPS